jgi:hypothetical protein
MENRYYTDLKLTLLQLHVLGIAPSVLSNQIDFLLQNIQRLDLQLYETKFSIPGLRHPINPLASY